MFDDQEPLDDLLHHLLMLAFLIFVFNPLMLTVATLWLSRLARRRGRRGHALPAFALLVAVEVALFTISQASQIDLTMVLWLVLSAAVIALALLRLLARPADDLVDTPAGS